MRRGRVILIAIVAAALGAWLGWSASGFMAVDNCLDAGGAWDHGHCVGLPG